MNEIPATVLVNPKLTPLTEEFEERWEGCLSIPGMRGAVPRYTKVRIDAYDVTGKPFSCEATGFHARVAQHECDHLDGILYPMRMLDLDCFGFNDAFEADEQEEQQH